jgi:hypothetical protein
MTTSIDPAYTEGSHEPGTSSASWWIDEGMPGTGDRPDWLPEKFKSVADMSKSYNELERRVGSAPNEYDISKGESWIEPDYGPIQDMLEYAKTKHVPQDVMDKMFESVGKYLDEFNVDPTEERAKLGEKAEERLQVIDNWAKSNFSAETYEALTSNLRTADAIKAIEEVRNKMNSNATTIPNSTHDSSQSAPSLQDIQAEMNKNLDRYKTDPQYRREMQAKMELASKASGYQDKQAY